LESLINSLYIVRTHVPTEVRLMSFN